MDLVSVLLTIILAGAIAIFVLAVIAYALHQAGKRDRLPRREECLTGDDPDHDKSPALEAQTQEPELRDAQTQEPRLSDPQTQEPRLSDSQSQKSETRDPQSLFWEYTTDGFLPVDPDAPGFEKESDDSGGWR